MPATASF